MIIKKFAFEIFNNFSALAITAFFKNSLFECTDGNCLSDLEELLWSIMGTRYALNFVAAFSAPIKRAVAYVMPAAAAEANDSDGSDDEEADADGPPAEAPRFEAELQLDEFEGMFDDYAEIVLQMGLVALFTLGWRAGRAGILRVGSPADDPGFRGRRPRTIRVAAAAPPRHCRRGRPPHEISASRPTRLRGISASRPRRRRDPAEGLRGRSASRPRLSPPRKKTAPRARRYLVPLLAAGEILLQIRVDAHKMTSQAQRPNPMPAESVGSWGVLMESMGFLAVFMNAGIVVFTTDSLGAYSLLQRWIVFFVLEQVLLALKVAVHAAIDDEPTELGELKRRQTHVVNRHKNVFFDDDDGGAGDGGAGDRAVAVDADALSVAALRADRMSRPAMKRLEYLRRKLLLCDKEVRDLRAQHRRATAAERYREDLGVSYSREHPDLALGLVNLRVEAADGLGSPRDPVGRPARETSRFWPSSEISTTRPRRPAAAAFPAAASPRVRLRGRSASRPRRLGISTSRAATSPA